jgi:hypothetical protein
MSDIERLAIIHGIGNKLHIRSGEDDGSAVFIRPDKLDGDGEIYLSLAEFVEALEAIGLSLPERTAT